MKKLFGAYRNSPYMIRPTVYQVLMRFLIALVLSFLWSRYIDHDLRGLPFAFEIFGIVYWLLVWFGYLRSDGVSGFNLRGGRRRSERASKHHSRDIIDFTEERVRPMDELEEDEKISCRVVSNMITGTLLLLIGIVMNLVV